MKPKKPILKTIKDGKKIFSIGTIMIDAENEQDAVRKYLRRKK